MCPLLLVLSLGFQTCSVSERVLQAAEQIPWSQYRYYPADGAEHADDLARLEQRLARMAVSVVYLEAVVGVLGQMFVGLVEPTHDGYQISVDDTLSPNAKLEVLAHEAGHVLQPPNLTIVQAQVFAELVSVEYCAKVGHDSRTTAAIYLAGFKPGFATARALRVDIQRAVARLLES